MTVINHSVKSAISRDVNTCLVGSIPITVMCVVSHSAGNMFPQYINRYLLKSIHITVTQVVGHISVCTVENAHAVLFI